MSKVALERACAAIESGDFQLALAIVADDTYEDDEPVTQRDPRFAPTIPCPGVTQ